MKISHLRPFLMMLLLAALPSLLTAQQDPNQQINAAWQALGSGQHEQALQHANSLFNRFANEARQQQQALSDYPVGDAAHQQFALNTVGTMLFIKGKALAALNRPQEAIEAWRLAHRDFSFAQAWDPNGWFWKPSLEARKEAEALAFEME